MPALLCCCCNPPKSWACSVGVLCACSALWHGQQPTYMLVKHAMLLITTDGVQLCSVLHRQGGGVQVHGD